MRLSRSNFARLSLLAAVGFMALPAYAADQVVYEEPVAVAYPDWSGFYVGGNVGVGGFGTNVTDLSDDMFDQVGGEMNLFGTAAIAGGQIGYNFMHGRYVFGVEGDIQWTSFDETSVTDGTDHRAEAEWNWYATLRARAGIADQNSLFYVTGGLAGVDAYYCGADNECVTEGDDDLAFTTTRLGYTFGAGVETRLADNWSLKGEYAFIGVPSFDRNYDDDEDEQASFETQAHTFRVGLNYHLGGLGGSAVVAPSFSPFQGFYVGVNGGFGGFGSNATDLDGDMFDGDGMELNVFGNGGIFGGQVGYNFSADRFVFGVEGDFQGTSFSEQTSIDDDHLAEGAWNWFATIRGRAGVTVGDTLFYGTGGVAFINADFCGADGECITDGDEDLDFTKTLTGYTVGAGAEMKLTDRISVKGEYLFVDGLDFEKQYDDGDPDARAEFSTEAHVFRIGLNYHLN
jgi:outer membrane immunogenic protein